MIVNAFSAAVAGSEYSVTKTEHTLERNRTEISLYSGC
jgi:hypothetical protein